MISRSSIWIRSTPLFSHHLADVPSDLVGALMLIVGTFLIVPFGRSISARSAITPIIRRWIEVTEALSFRLNHLAHRTGWAGVAKVESLKAPRLC